MKKQENPSADSIDEERLKEIVSTNLSKLLELLNLSKTQFAQKMNIAASTVTNYLTPSDTRIPPVSFLMNVCLLPEIKELGLDITINDLVSGEFDPMVRDKDAVLEHKPVHHDFLGNYYCYYFDQSKEVSLRETETARDLRFGVITFFDEPNTLTGQIGYEAYAMFYKASEREKAVALKTDVDALFGSDSTPFSVRNTAIRSRYRRESGFYAGGVKFSSTHAFVGITGNSFRDCAMITFYTPSKKDGVSYIGGIGTVSSVTHGSDRMPVAQKIIISQVKLRCPDEVIAEYLNMTSHRIDLNDQAKMLAELCSKLFHPQTKAGYLDDSDRTAIIKERLNQLVRDYIHNCIFTVSAVSKEEDKKIYSLIRHSMDNRQEDVW